MNSLVALDAATGEPVRITIEGPTIAAAEPAARYDGDEHVAPAFWDIQTNGRLGISFSDPGITPEQVAATVRAHAAFGTARLCPTLITASPEATLRGVAAIASACEAHHDVAAMVPGIHLEGPAISEVDGYRGAHPLEHVRDPDWAEFRALQDAAGGRIVLVTLAPERHGALDFIRRATREGIVVALGHTAADGPTLAAAAAAGARLSTHLGNGIVSNLARHPNPIWNQAADDRLSASLIADGHHLDPATLRVLSRAMGPGRTILVSDASPLAGLPPGRYGGWEVEPAGRIVVAGTPYLAGANRDLAVGVGMLAAVTGWPLADVLACATTNPARLLDRTAPSIRAGRPANLIRFGWSEAGMDLRATCVDGVWAG